MPGTIRIIVRGVDQSTVDRAVSSIKGLPERESRSKHIDMDTTSTELIEEIGEIAKTFQATVEARDNILTVKGYRHQHDSAVNAIFERIHRYMRSLNHTPLPESWTRQTKNLKMVDVSQSSSEWAHVNNKFSATLPNATITRIQRVQKKDTWVNFCIEKRKLKEKWGVEPQEEELFHGTRKLNPQDLIKDEAGWRVQYANEDCLWGKGSYFAVNSSYSHTYAYQSQSPPSYQMLVADVLIGKFKDFGATSDRTLKKPPALPNELDDDGEPRLADSVKGITKGCVVFILYDNYRAYPKYLLTYQ